MKIKNLIIGALTLLPEKKEAKIKKSFCSGIINILIDGFAYNTRGHFAHCSYFSGLGKILCNSLNSKPIELLEGRCRKGSNRGGQQSPQQ